MEQIECSKMSAYKIQTPGNYPEECLHHYDRLFFDPEGGGTTFLQNVGNYSHSDMALHTKGLKSLSIEQLKFVDFQLLYCTENSCYLMLLLYVLNLYWIKTRNKISIPHSNLYLCINLVIIITKINCYFNSSHVINYFAGELTLWHIGT